MHTVLAAVISLGLVSASIAAKPAKTSKPFVAPDVMILILSMFPPKDQVTIQYNSVVSTQQVNADLTELGKISGWTFEGAESTTDSAGTPGSVETTSMNFTVLRIANYTDGLLPISPFVQTFKRYKNIEIRYILNKDFKFRGLKDYENEYVKVAMSQQGNSYVYKVQVVDSDFDNLLIPLKPTPNAAAGSSAGMSVGAKIAIVLLIAVVGAVLAYLLTSFVAKRRAGSP